MKWTKGTRSPIRKFLRWKKKFPTVWCKGCSNGIVMQAIIRAVQNMGYDKDEVAMVSGIGCAGRMPVYVDFNTMHTTHGRALAFSTGLKLARPDLHVLAVMGDGDALAIGGNHFIHAARRNMDFSAIILNNNIYGMTRGQYSPTTPLGMRATTAVYGQVEPPVDPCALAQGAGATFVARGTAYHAQELTKLIETAMRHVGFAVVEVASTCPTSYGRMNKLGTPAEMLLAQKERYIPVAKWQKLSPEDRADKQPRGVLHHVDGVPDYETLYQQVIETAQQEAGL